MAGSSPASLRRLAAAFDLLAGGYLPMAVRLEEDANRHLRGHVDQAAARPVAHLYRKLVQVMVSTADAVCRRWPIHRKVGASAEQHFGRARRPASVYGR